MLLYILTLILTFEFEPLIYERAQYFPKLNDIRYIALTCDDIDMDCI